MVALGWAAAVGLLEGEVLLAAEQEEIAHRRIVVGPVQHGVGGDADAAAEGDRVGRKPARRGHGLVQRLLAADHADIDGIAGMAVRCVAMRAAA